MRSLLKYLLFLALILLFSCDKSGLIVYCPDCVKDEPKSVTLDIKVDKLASTSYKATILRIYSGNLEDSVLLITYNISSTDLTYKATLNKKYTFVAIYIKEGVTYTVVNSTIPRVKYEKNLCNQPCYFVYGKKVNLSLKYTMLEKFKDKIVTDHFYIAGYLLLK